MPSFLLVVAANVMLFGLAKISRTTRPSHGTPWGALLVWAVLFGAGVSIWLMSAPVH